MNVNVRSGLLLGVVLMAVTVGSAAAARAVTSAQIVSSLVPPKPGPCFTIQKPCRQPSPTPGPKR